MGSLSSPIRTASPAQREQDAAFFNEHHYLPRPRLVQWFATLRCHLTCPHCLATCESSGLGPDMPLAQVIDLIDQVADLGVEQFLITGGEPLIRQDLPDVVARLHQRRIAWSLNTAAMPSPSQRRAFASYPPMFVAVSVDGPRSVHDAFRGREGAFDQAMQAIRFFRSLPGVQVALGTTVTRFNFGALRETF